MFHDQVGTMRPKGRGPREARDGGDMARRATGEADGVSEAAVASLRLTAVPDPGAVRAWKGRGWGSCDVFSQNRWREL